MVHNCSDSDDPIAVEEVEEKFTLTVLISTTEGGSISNQSGPFTEETKVTLTTNDNENYTFKEYTDTQNGTTSPMDLITLTWLLLLKKVPLKDFTNYFTNLKN